MQLRHVWLILIVLNNLQGLMNESIEKAGVYVLKQSVGLKTVF